MQFEALRFFLIGLLQIAGAPLTTAVIKANITHATDPIKLDLGKFYIINSGGRLNDVMFDTQNNLSNE